MTNPAQLARPQGNNQEADIAGFGRFGDLAGLAWLAAPAGLAARAGWPGWAGCGVSQQDWLAGWGMDAWARNQAPGPTRGRYEGEG